MNRPTLSIALLVSLGSFAACSGGDSQSGIRADGLAVTCTTEGDADTEVYVCEPADGDQSCESPAEGGSSLALWPPNHKLHLIALADCAALPDDCGTDLVSATITAITADEAVDVGAGGDGHTKNYDMRIVDATTVEVRSERQGAGDGRVYRVWFTNAAGTAGSCEIQVPHDQGPFGGAIDSGEVVRIVR
jgi:hypothetical protein